MNKKEIYKKYNGNDSKNRREQTVFATSHTNIDSNALTIEKRRIRTVRKSVLNGCTFLHLKQITTHARMIIEYFLSAFFLYSKSTFSAFAEKKIKPPTKTVKNVQNIVNPIHAENVSDFWLPTAISPFNRHFNYLMSRNVIKYPLMLQHANINLLHRDDSTFLFFHFFRFNFLSVQFYRLA